MTAAVITKINDNVTGALTVTYSNETKVRLCNLEDFNKTNMVPSFQDLTALTNNLYCPDSYENVTLASQRMKNYEQSFSWRF